MRILIVSHLFKNPLEHSKLPNLFDLVQALSAEVDVEVVAPVPWVPPILLPRRWQRFARIPREHRYGRVRVRYPRHLVFPRRILYVVSGSTFLRALRRTVSGERYDIVWAHYAFPDGWAAVRFARSLGIPSLVTVRGEDVRSDVRHVGVRKRVQEALTRATGVTSPHPETTDLAKRLGRKAVVELRNGVDLERFGRGDAIRIRRELGLDGKFVVTFIGHLVTFKDPETFVEAAAVRAPDDGLAFLVAGSPGRGRAQTNLPALAKRLGLRNRVLFLGDRGDVPDILAASDVFVALSPYENIWSNTLVEAMAAKVPCIVTRAGWSERNLVHAEDAWLIPPRSAKDLRDAIDHLRQNPEVRTALAEAARRRVAKEFDLRKITREALALCRALVDSRVGDSKPLS
jgi:teichuronic acid biosynthesis glycosyltransferase TuaC